jgi:solute carrier family 6 amino acid transporter-like protein 5/7/9/14
MTVIVLQKLKLCAVEIHGKSAVCFSMVLTSFCYRDAMIVTTLDTFTSLLAGCTIFSILGNLMHELRTTDIAKVVKGRTSLAFVSYADDIAKFDTVPQVCNIYYLLRLRKSNMTP